MNISIIVKKIKEEFENLLQDVYFANTARG